MLVLGLRIWERRQGDTYDVGGGQFQEVVGRRVRRVLLGDVAERGLRPVDVHGRHVYAPEDDVLAVAGDGAGEVDVEVLDLVHEGRLVDRVLDPGDEVGVVGLVAVGGDGVRGRRREGVGVGRVLVREDGERVRLVLQRGARRHRVDPEPVRPRGLVGRDDDVVPLADGEEDVVGCPGLDGDEIAGDDLGWVSVMVSGWGRDRLTVKLCESRDTRNVLSADVLMSRSLYFFPFFSPLVTA